MEVDIVLMGILEGIQVLAKVVLHVPVTAIAQILLDGGDEFGVKVAGEGVTGVVHQDAHHHDRIVLDMVRGSGRGGQVFANAMSSFLGCGGARLGNFDDTRQVDEFFSLLYGTKRSKISSAVAGGVVGGIPLQWARTVLSVPLLESQNVV